jgi:hypothetical protein
MNLSKIRENLHEMSHEIVNTFKEGKFPQSDLAKIKKLKRDFHKVVHNLPQDYL